MNKRQTVYQPDVKGLQYPLLEQKGEENEYRLSGREIKDGVQGDIVHILGTAKEINKYAGNEIVKLSTNEKVQRCAKQLHEIFLRLKEKDPTKESIDIYADKEGREAITDLLKGMERNAASVLDTKLKTALAEYGLTCSRPATDYFVEERMKGAAWFKIRFSGKDTIKEEYLDKKSSTGAKELHKIFLRLKEKNPTKENINVYADKEGRKVITDLLQGAEKDAVKLLDTKLKTALAEYGLISSRPAIDYFIDENMPGSPWFEISEEKTEKIAA